MPDFEDFGYEARADYLADQAFDRIDDFDQDDIAAVLEGFDRRESGERLY